MITVKKIYLFATINIFAIILCAAKPLFVNFDKSMSMRPEYNKSKPRLSRDPIFMLSKKLYQKYIMSDLRLTPKPRIPKIIHQIWLGSPMPERFSQLAKTWKQHHPTWKYRLWTDEDVDKFGLKNRAMYDATSNYGEKADIVRYEILYRIGGLYVDTDFECIKPFDTLHHCCDFYTGLWSAEYFLVPNGLIASAPGNIMLKETIHSMKRGAGEEDTFVAIHDRTGPQHFTKCIKKIIPHFKGRAVFFPVSYFYSWPPSERLNNSPEQIKSWFKPESLAVHHWAVSWLKD
jgi:mannosyltransferase OCH1-like enzyme